MPCWAVGVAIGPNSAPLATVTPDWRPAPAAPEPAPPAPWPDACSACVESDEDLSFLDPARPPAPITPLPEPEPDAPSEVDPPPLAVLVEPAVEAVPLGAAPAARVVDEDVPDAEPAGRAPPCAGTRAPPPMPTPPATTP